MGIAKGTVIVREFGEYESGGFVLDLRRLTIHDCIGCWNCWLKTPGRCVHHDLDEFYRAYLAADRVQFFLKVSMGFISGNVKTLFDRMIPHYLPYITYKTGESMHAPRYDRYPNVEVYYQGSFEGDDERKLFEEYLARVFYQFYTKNALIRPIDAYADEGARVWAL